MKLKVYFDVHPWTNQSNVFFFGNIPVEPAPQGSKRYVAEIEVPDVDADFGKASVSNIAEI
jgi:hypothetical protein